MIYSVCETQLQTGTTRPYNQKFILSAFSPVPFIPALFPPSFPFNLFPPRSGPVGGSLKSNKKIWRSAASSHSGGTAYV